MDKLKDNRGRTKPVEEMTEVEKLRAEMRILEAKNRQLEIENAFKKTTGAEMEGALTEVCQKHLYIAIEFLNTDMGYFVKEMCIALKLNNVY